MAHGIEGADGGTNTKDSFVPPWVASSSFKDLQQYGQSLLPDSAVTARPPPLGHDETETINSMNGMRLEEDSQEDKDGRINMRCREAVEVLTRNPKKSEFVTHECMYHMKLTSHPTEKSVL